MNLFFAFLVPALLSMVLMPWLINLALRWELVDTPNRRKIHAMPIPRIGGIGIAIAALLPLLWWLPVIESETRGLYIAITGLLAVGFVDDVINLDYRWKLAGQIIMSIIAINHGIVINHIHMFGFEPIPDWVAYPLTLFFLVGVTNAINMSDGLDGLAAGLIFLTFAMICLLSFQIDGIEIVLITLAVMGASFGFLRYNTHPAVVFLGDAGSQVLGFLAASLAIILTQKIHQPYNAALPLLLLGLPILDTLSVMIQRFRSQSSLFTADNRHIHHLLLSRGFSHPQAVAVIYLIHSVFLIAAYLLRYESQILTLVVYFTVSALPLYLLYWSGKHRWRIGGRRHSAPLKERRNVWLRNIEWLPGFSKSAIKFTVMGFIVGLPWIPEKVPFEYSILACFCIAVNLHPFNIPRFSPDRLTTNVLLVCLVNLSLFIPSDFWVKHLFINTHIVVLTCMLFIAIRLTRRIIFPITTTDLLITLLIVGIIALLGDQTPQHIDQFFARAIVLFFATEFLFRCAPPEWQQLRTVSLLGWIILAIRGFIT